jgi:hypothetical protein
MPLPSRDRNPAELRTTGNAGEWLGSLPAISASAASDFLYEPAGRWLWPPDIWSKGVLHCCIVSRVEPHVLVLFLTRSDAAASFGAATAVQTCPGNPKDGAEAAGRPVGARSGGKRSIEVPRNLRRLCPVAATEQQGWAVQSNGTAQPRRRRGRWRFRHKDCLAANRHRRLVRSVEGQVDGPITLRQ